MGRWRRAAHAVWLGALLLGLASPQPAAAVRRALVVGINEYAGESEAGRWRDLRGAVNDARAARELLISRWGFEADDVHLLLDGDASREAILEGIRRHLVEASAPGDVALFYYAGHGSQAGNPSSLEVDALDETLVPSDSNRGALDIRDKELRRLFNDGIDRGAQVIAIVDSCSSGSILRSFDEVRFLPPASGIALPPLLPDERGSPAERGALILSAAASGRPARETRDALGRPRGAFSHALLRALREAAPSESAEQLFLRARAALLADGLGQVPILDATPERRRLPFLGSGESAAARARVAVLRVEGSEAWIDGGLASGIHPGTLLAPVGSEPRVRLRVVANEGVGASRARIESGRPERLAPGTLLEIRSWAPPAGVALRVATAPDGVAPPTSLIQALRAHPAATAGSLEWVEPERAHYRLQGERGADGAPRFAWVRGEPDAGEISSGLPARSDAFDLPSAEVGLSRSLDVLLRIRAWLTLEAPPASDDFPYHLMLRRYASGRRVLGGLVREGEAFRLTLERDPDRSGPVRSRHVYVFAIDAHGEQVLLFPDASGNADNLLPPANLEAEAPRSIPIGSISVAPPYGTETLVLLTSERPLSDPRLLEGRGVRTQRIMGNLETILSGVGRVPTEDERALPTSTQWSVERISLRSRPR